MKVKQRTNHKDYYEHYQYVFGISTDTSLFSTQSPIDGTIHNLLMYKEPHKTATIITGEEQWLKTGKKSSQNQSND